MTDVDRPDVSFRRPTEDDHARVAPLLDEWWGGRRLPWLARRLWFQHFTGTSWIAEDADGHLLGFLVGFISPDDPETGYVHVIGTNPNRRRHGIGGALYRHFFDDVASRGGRRVTAITWPGNRASVDFHRSLGFRVVDGPGTQNLYGTPAFPDYDGEGEDRVVLVRPLEDGRT